jgi:glycosyltransferase involved in cell wall biosynthesis
MLITVIIPVYNCELQIPSLLRNLNNQRFCSFEVIFQDGCSTDMTALLIKEETVHNERFRLIQEKDCGIYDAMNKSIDHANGEWVYFMGSDDRLYDSETLNSISGSLSEGRDIVYGDVIWIPGDILEAGECGPMNIYERNINHQRIFYRKEIFKKYGRYNLKYKYASDHELNIRLFCDTSVNRIYINIPIAYYNANGFSANQCDHAFWLDWKTIFINNFNRYLPRKYMYHKLGWYCRYLIEKKKYSEALPIFLDVLSHTVSPGFICLTFKQMILSLKK